MVREFPSKESVACENIISPQFIIPYAVGRCKREMYARGGGRNHLKRRSFLPPLECPFRVLTPPTSLALPPTKCASVIPSPQPRKWVESPREGRKLLALRVRKANSNGVALLSEKTHMSKKQLPHKKPPMHTHRRVLIFIID